MRPRLRKRGGVECCSSPWRSWVSVFLRGCMRLGRCPSSGSHSRWRSLSYSCRRPRTCSSTALVTSIAAACRPRVAARRVHHASYPFADRRTSPRRTASRSRRMASLVFAVSGGRVEVLGDGSPAAPADHCLVRPGPPRVPTRALAWTTICALLPRPSPVSVPVSNWDMISLGGGAGQGGRARPRRTRRRRGVARGAGSSVCSGQASLLARDP